jgi:hypothetical protein
VIKSSRRHTERDTPATQMQLRDRTRPRTYSNSHTLTQSHALVLSITQSVNHLVSHCHKRRTHSQAKCTHAGTHAGKHGHAHTPSYLWRWSGFKDARTCAPLGGLAPSLACAGATLADVGDEDVGWARWRCVGRVGVLKHSVLAAKMLATQAHGSSRRPLPAGRLGVARRVPAGPSAGPSARTSAGPSTV